METITEETKKKAKQMIMKSYISWRRTLFAACWLNVENLFKVVNIGPTQKGLKRKQNERQV